MQLGNAHTVLVGKPEDKLSFEKHRCRGEDNLYITKGSVTVWPGFVWLSAVSSCEHGDKPSGFVKDREFRYELSNSHFLRKAFVP